jgi:NAD(P)H-dependent flavin oxidoreductase YrpB (nitropropane dioxygenase family)
MRRNKVCGILGIKHPILQAGIHWVSNPELVAAVSNAGGMGILHPTAGMAHDGEPLVCLRDNIRRVQGLTRHPFGVALYLANPNILEFIDVITKEGVHIAVTYGGSAALHTGVLKDREFKVLHQVATVRQARGAEAQGVDIIIADGFEAGGLRGTDQSSTMVLVPQVVRSVSLPVIASGGIVDSRGYVAAMALGADGVQIGSRFVATRESIAHLRYKEAIVAAIDTGTIIVGGDRRPTRILRTSLALQLKGKCENNSEYAMRVWEVELGPAKVRAAMLEGDLDVAVGYCGAGAGLISDVLSVHDVFDELVEGGQSLIKGLS